MIAVSVISAGTEERAANVRAICSALPEAVVTVDDGSALERRKHGRVGCWPIARRAWTRPTGAASQHLVLEDDAELCAGFRERLASVALQAPGACVSLFRGSWDCSVATVMPVTVIPRWLEWVDTAEHGFRFLPHHDHLITWGMKELGIEHLETEPSLVQHRPPTSLLGHPPNEALRFASAPRFVSLRRRWLTSMR